MTANDCVLEVKALSEVAAMPFSQKIIMLVDDSESFVMNMSILLRRMGFHIIPAEDGVNALKMLNIITPDLIILDVNMPRMGGIEVLKDLKKHRKLSKVPVLMASGLHEEDVVQESRELGCAGFLIKPVSLRDLHDALQDALQGQLGWKRRHIRANANIKVTLTSDGAEEELFTESLSEGGIYLRKQDPFPVGARVRVRIPAGSSDISVKGSVIYNKRVYGDIFKVPPGMAIEFRDVPPEDARTLSGLVSGILTRDILESQGEAVISDGGHGRPRKGALPDQPAS